MKKLYELVFGIVFIVISLVICFSVIYFVNNHVKKKEKAAENKYKAEIERLKRLNMEDMPCVNGKLFIKENDKLIKQYKDCEFYNNQLYLVEKNGNLIRLGLQNQ